MARKITEECISCGACETECPNDAITESEDLFVIDADKCDECKDKDEAGCVAVCPVAEDAIVTA